MSAFLELGDYKVDLVNTLGQGTFGVVYRGYHKKSNKLVAVKKVEITSDQYGYEAMKEIKNFQHLGQHPNIVQLLDFHYLNNSFWMLMEFCDSGDLQGYFKKNKPELEFKINVMFQCVSAINHMHNMSSPIVHRDIKPANIMMKKGDDGKLVVKVTDFGLSKVVEEQDQAMTMLFSTVAGTPGFMAPEFFANEKYTKSVDVFALGLVFLAMVKHGESGKKDLLPLTENALKTRHILPVGAEMYNAHKDGKPMPVIVSVKDTDNEQLRTSKELIIGMTHYERKDRMPLNDVEPILAKLLGKNVVAHPKYRTEKSTEQTNENKPKIPKKPHGAAGGGGDRLLASTSSDEGEEDIAVRLLKQALEEELKEKLNQLEREGFSREDAMAKIRDMAFIDQLAHVIGDKKPADSSMDVGDKVMVTRDGKEAKRLQENFGGWSEMMNRYLGKIGEVKERVLHVLKVQFDDGQIWSFNPDLLTKVDSAGKPVPKVDSVARGMEEMAIGGGPAVPSNFNRGDVVVIPEDENLVKCLNEEVGGWDPKMSMCLGVKGIVNKVNPNGSVMVECINGEDWNFNQELLVKVKTSSDGIEPGDFVIIEKEVERLQKLQANHGGWAPDMKDVVGRAGIVKELFSRNRARVEVRGGKWIFNRQALQIVAKGEEMLKAILKKKEMKDFS